jgi:thioredoxin-related protein
MQDSYGALTLPRFLNARVALYIALLLLSRASFAQTNEDPGALRWHQWDEGIASAQASGKWMLVDVYTTRCQSCKMMDRSVYSNQTVQGLLAESFIPVKLNAESSNLVTNGGKQYTEQEWAALLEVKSHPMTLVIDQKFQIVARLKGYVSPERFVRFLKFIKGKYYEQFNFYEFLERVPDDQ